MIKSQLLAGALLFMCAALLSASDMLEPKSGFSLREMFKTITSCFSAAAPAANQTPGANLAPEQAKEYLAAEKPVLLDIRTPEEFAAGRLEGAALLDFYAADFKDRLGNLDRGAKYLLYCRSGNRSGRALDMMKQLGFPDARHIQGGIGAWQTAGYPVVK